MKRFLALGDSYTIGESVPESGRWPVQLVEQLRRAGFSIEDPLIIAKTGWTTAELMAGIEDTNLTPPYDLVTLLIGVNNQYRGNSKEVYRAEFVELVQLAINFAGGNPDHVIVVNIPDWGASPFATIDPRAPETISNEIRDFNEINREEARKLGVRYVDIFTISLSAYENKNLIASDGLHPSEMQYTLWTNEIFPVARNILE